MATSTRQRSWVRGIDFQEQQSPTQCSIHVIKTIYHSTGNIWVYSFSKHRLVGHDPDENPEHNHWCISCFQRCIMLGQLSSFSRQYVVCIASLDLISMSLTSISSWRDVSAQMWRYVADRTGIISTANLPLIWIFGIRNNTLMWLTGWDFATYNNFHRWVARIATVEAVVHSVAYTYMIVQGTFQLTPHFITKLTVRRRPDLDFDVGSLRPLSSKGILLERGSGRHHLSSLRTFLMSRQATIFMCVICGFSIYGIRRYCYETFLVVHIGLSVGVLVTMW